MGQLNEFGVQQFTAALRPGEALELMGIGSIPGRDQRTYALLGATTQRLLLVECPADAWMNAPEPKAKSTMAFEYGELAQVAAGPAANQQGPAKRLALKSGRGEVTLILMQELKSIGNVWNYTGFDDHREAYDVYPEWLARHAAAGSFHTPQGAQGALAELKNARAMRAQGAQQAQQAAAAAKEAASIKWPYVLMAISLLVGGLGGFIIFRGNDQLGVSEDGVKATKQSAAKKGEYLHEHPDEAATQIKDAQRRVDEAQSTITTGMAVAGVSPLGFVGFLVLGVVLNKKKRERLSAAGR